MFSMKTILRGSVPGGAFRRRYRLRLGRSLGTITATVIDGFGRHERIEHRGYVDRMRLAEPCAFIATG